MAFGRLQCVSSAAAEQFTPEEADLLNFVRLNLESLAEYANEYRDCLALYLGLAPLPFSETNLALRFIPAKQAVVSCYNYRKAMDITVTAIVRSSKHLRRLVDTKALEETKQAFRALHPSTKELRQAIMHQAELFQTPERLRETSLNKESHIDGIRFRGGSISRGNIINETLQFSFAGQMYYQDLSVSAGNALLDNAVTFINIFRPVGTRAELRQPR